MKEVSFTIFDLCYISFLKYFYPYHISKKYLKNTYGYRKQILFECGGGYWSYYCGIVKMIKETYSRDYLDDIAWVGASAGVSGESGCRWRRRAACQGQSPGWRQR